METMTLTAFCEKVSHYRHWYGLFFQSIPAPREERFIYPEALASVEIQKIISDYIYYQYGNLKVNKQIFDNFYDHDLTEIEVYNYIYNVIKMNEFNINTKAKLLTAEYRPDSNYEKWSEIKNAYDKLHKTNAYGEDVNTLVNGATSAVSTDRTSAYDSTGWTDTDMNEVSTAIATDTNTRAARSDSETTDKREDVMTEHTYGNIGTMTISDILAGVWALGEMEFVKFVADIIVNSLCICVFDVEVY